MKDRVVISISSAKGTKEFNLSKWVARSLRGLGVAVFSGLVGAGVSIYYLMDEVDFAKNKQVELESKSNSLIEEVENLQELKVNLETDLLEREERITFVSDRLGELERVLGFEVDEVGEELESRLDAAAITSSVRTVMLTQIPNGAPVMDSYISSGFGKRKHPVSGKFRMHRGTDFGVNIGTPIYAPADGVIEVTRPSNKGSGNYLRMQHSYGFTSSYSHLQKFAVKSGDFVRKGDLIAYSGNSGLSSGPHLHYEIRFVGRALNPYDFIKWDMDNFETIFAKVKTVHWDSLVNRVEEGVSKHLQLSSQYVARTDDDSATNIN
ncbi:M23 family metallopeptidase [Vibrio maerlii]|uniref:M23 family metallopeptidase n=1 Tax=Vibrio maerlii TaxID=2231648 RepID=UPI000E3D1C32|nr:M23 family metallopeptidase [Vibrio maerlii]